MSEWNDMSTCGLALYKIQLSMLVQYKADIYIISLKSNLFSSWYGWKIAAELVLCGTDLKAILTVSTYTIFQLYCLW